jgi:hypothetical protein
MTDDGERWPSLPYERWKGTRTTLHLYAQIVGKVRVALTPTMPQWANSPLQLTARGLTTGPLWGGGHAVQLDLDLLSHELVLTDEGGSRRALPLTSGVLAEVYADLLDALRRLGVTVTLDSRAADLPQPVDFATDTEHREYDTAWAERFLGVLSRVGAVLTRYRAGFWAKQTPVDLWWGSFDLSVTRFSGRPASLTPDMDLVRRVAMDAEQSAAGFWPGHERWPEAAFFAYTYPKPEAIEATPVKPAGARWSAELGEFVLSYEDVAAAPVPADALLEFFQSTYEAGATLAGWDRGLVERRPPLRRPAGDAGSP